MFLHYECRQLFMVFNSFKFDNFHARKRYTLIYFPQNLSLGRMLKPLKINLGHKTLKLPIESLTNCVILAPSVKMTR